MDILSLHVWLVPVILSVGFAHFCGYEFRSGNLRQWLIILIYHVELNVKLIIRH